MLKCGMLLVVYYRYHYTSMAKLASILQSIKKTPCMHYVALRATTATIHGYSMDIGMHCPTTRHPNTTQPLASVRKSVVVKKAI